MLECGIGMGGYVGGMEDFSGEGDKNKCRLVFCSTCTTEQFKVRKKDFRKDSFRATQCKYYRINRLKGEVNHGKD